MADSVEVVVASPDAGLRGQVSLALGGGRFAVTEVTDTGEVVDRIAQHPPDVLIADARLEGHGALALARTLRDQPETATVRVLVLTSPGDPLPEDAPGVDAALTTPFTSLALLRRLEAVLAP